MEVGGVWRSKRVLKKNAEVHRIFLKEESRAQIKKVINYCLINYCRRYFWVFSVGYTAPIRLTLVALLWRQ